MHYIDFKEKDILPSDPKMAFKIKTTSDNFIVTDNILYRVTHSKRTDDMDSSRFKIVLPRVLRREALLAYHDSPAGGGHQGVKRTIEAIQTKYWIPHINEFVKSYVDSCETCQKIKRSFLPKVPLHPMPVKTQSFNRLHMDILGPLPEASDKSKYILLVVDSLSKWPEAFPISNQEAVTIANTLYRDIFTRYGAVKSIVSDRGRNFMSKLVSALCEIFQTKRIYTSAFHPQTNSHCERYNFFIAQSLRAYIDKDHSNWPQLLPGILMAFRLLPAGSSGISPFHMLFGREMSLPFDLDLQQKAQVGKQAEQCIAQWFRNLQICQEVAQKNVLKSQEEYKKYYDKKTKAHSFQPGDLVLLQDKSIKKGLSPKLMPKYKGPYYITLRTDKDTYRLRQVQDNKEHKSLVHHNRLKRYYSPEDRQLPHTQPTIQQSNNESPQTTTNNDASSQKTETTLSTDMQEVEKIIKMINKGNKRWYYVQWVDAPDQRTWELAENVPPKLIQEYHTHRTYKGKKRKRVFQKKSKFSEKQP